MNCFYFNFNLRFIWGKIFHQLDGWFHRITLSSFDYFYMHFLPSFFSLTHHRLYPGKQKAPVRPNKVFIDIETSLYKLSAEPSKRPNDKSFRYTSYHHLTGNLGLSRGVWGCVQMWTYIRTLALPRVQYWKNKPFVIITQTFEIISTCSCPVGF